VQAVSASARIAALHCYPVKSAAGLELEQALLTPAGFEDDRRWMLVTTAGRFITQREVPRLALLKPRLSPSALLLAGPAAAADLDRPIAPGTAACGQCLAGSLRGV
jgi:uncharacterized protein YcbX